MQPGKRHQVHVDFAQVAIELAWEAKARSDSTHGSRDEVVEIAIGRSRKLQGPEADIVQGLIIHQEAHVCVFY